MTSEKCIIYK